MDGNRLKKILQFSKENAEETSHKIKHFCSFAKIDFDIDILNLLQITRSSFREKGYLVFEMPFADSEIGAFSYTGDGLGYVCLNSALPKVNVNFALAHEVYHVFYGEKKYPSRVEFSHFNGDESKEEYAANLFAGMLLMPEFSFRRLYQKFHNEFADTKKTLISLMAYYQVPYMAVLIRSLELDQISKESSLEELLTVNKESINSLFLDLWLDEDILKATFKDDFNQVRKLVQLVGEDYLNHEYFSEQTLKKALSNMDNLYQKIKGD